MRPPSVEHLRKGSEHRCKDKAKHRTFKKAIKSRDRRAYKFKIELRVYFCPRCGFWHLTSEV